MLHDLLADLNALLGQHPHLIQVMRTLFWLKYYTLLGIFGVFVYLAMTDEQLNQAPPGASERSPSNDQFAA